VKLLSNSFSKSGGGFALPTVLIASTVMLLILATTLVSVTSGVAVTLSNRHYNSYAKEASASGLAMAQACLKANNYTPQWSDASPLRPNTNCSGIVQPLVSPYVYDDGTLQTSFTINEPTNLANGVQRVVVQSKANLIRTSTAQVWQTYNDAAYATISGAVSFDSITFGYVGGGSAFFGIIDPQGSVSALGYNAQGQLGNGTTTSATSPRNFVLPVGLRVSSLYSNFLSVGKMMYAITTDGSMYGAGANDSGQLGNGTFSTTQSTPVKFNLPAGVSAKYVSNLADATYVIASNNNIYAAGNCAYGQLGSNYTISGCSNQANPVRVALPTPTASDPNTLPVATNDWLQSTNLATDRSNVYVRMQGGRVYGWGDNSVGELANGTLNSSSVPVKIGTYGDAGQPKAKQIAFDGDVIYILGDDGKVNAAGMNIFGQLGGAAAPVGSSTGYCIDNANNSPSTGTRVRIWGCNNSTAQKLEWNYDGSIRFSPDGVNDLCIDNANSGSANGNPIITYTCNGTGAQKWEMRDDGSIYNAQVNKCLDNPGNSPTQGTELQLHDCNGTPAQVWSLKPAITLSTVPIPASSGSVTRITADQWATLYLTQDGKVWGAGVNYAGQLGNGTHKIYNPALTQFQIPAGRKAIDFYTTKTGVYSTLEANTYIVLDDGSVIGAGGNSYGQLGNGTTTSYEASPKKMNLPVGVKAKSVQTGFGTTVILTEDGKIYTVGNNNYGQLGDGTTNNSSTPLARQYINTRPLILY